MSETPLDVSGLTEALKKPMADFITAIVLHSTPIVLGQLAQQASEEAIRLSRAGDGARARSAAHAASYLYREAAALRTDLSRTPNPNKEQ